MNIKTTDWRFPDADGLYLRNLDCLQLSVKEVLRWQGETALTETFLEPFDCKLEGYFLRRSEPKLNNGYTIVQYHFGQSVDIRRHIEETMDTKGYCLLYYNAFYFPFSSYYQKYDIQHWALVVNCDGERITLIDEGGRKEYFERQKGEIRWTEFCSAWPEDKGGFGYLTRILDQRIEWEQAFTDCVRKSVQNMGDGGGLAAFESCLCQLYDLSLGTMSSELAKLEFNFNYYRKLRELWRTAVVRKVIPLPWYRSNWIEELEYLCISWSLVIGVLTKWSRQPTRDYKSKLMGYLTQTYESERRLHSELRLALKEMDERRVV